MAIEILDTPDLVNVVDWSLDFQFRGRRVLSAENSDRRIISNTGKATIEGNIYVIGLHDYNPDTTRNRSHILPKNIPLEAGDEQAAFFKDRFNSGTALWKLPLSLIQPMDVRLKYTLLPQLPIINSVAAHTSLEYTICNFATAISQSDFDSMLYSNYTNSYIEIGGRVYRVRNITLTQLIIFPIAEFTPPIQPVDPEHAHIYLRITEVNTIRTASSPTGMDVVDIPVVQSYGPSTGTIPPIPPEIPNQAISIGAMTNFITIGSNQNYVTIGS